jgi:hypothetical protein
MKTYPDDNQLSTLVELFRQTLGPAAVAGLDPAALRRAILALAQAAHARGRADADIRQSAEWQRFAEEFKSVQRLIDTPPGEAHPPPPAAR